MCVDEVMEELARELGEPPVSQEEMGVVLKLAREVAHSIERKMAPVAAYLAGVHAGRLGVAEQAVRLSALQDAVRAIMDRLPPAPPPDASPDPSA
jgi:Domain of unknown function (DUF6457)